MSFSSSTEDLSQCPANRIYIERDLAEKAKQQQQQQLCRSHAQASNKASPRSSHVPSRRQVPTATSEGTSQLQPQNFPTHVPARKPLPPRVAADRKYDMPQAPPQSFRTIGRNANGRFPNLDEAKVGRIAPSSCPSFGSSHQRGSSSGSGSVEMGRRDSFNSNTRPETPGRPTSSHSTSRRGSLKSLFRRASNEVAHVASLITMNETQRNRWRREERERLAAEVEEDRQKNPSLRPAYQRQYISDKEQREAAQAATGQRSSSSSSYDPRVSATTQHSRGSALTPVDQFLAIDKVLAQKRGSHESQAAVVDAQLQPTLRKGEKIALNLSETLDFVKNIRQPRKLSDDSDMDFTDAAPAELLFPCARCKKPVGGKEFLREGLCARCHQQRIQDWFDQNTPPGPSKDGSDYGSSYKEEDSDSETDSDSRSSDARRSEEVDEEEYMKTAVDRKIRRIRLTVYDDPGNPFTCGDSDDEGRRASHGTLPPGLSEDFWDRKCFSGRSSTTNRHRARSPLPAPKARPPETASLIASLEEELTTPTVLAQEVMLQGDDYVAPRTLWTKSSPVQRGEQEGSATDRNTRFYGFYDDMLNEYESGTSTM